MACLLRDVRHLCMIRLMESDLDLITSSQAGVLLGRSARTVHRLVTDGQLSYAKQLTGPNGAYLFHRAEVERLAAKRADAKSAA